MNQCGDREYSQKLKLSQRERAEARLAELPPAGEIDQRPAEEILQDLRVHQIELEMQNDQLRRAQLALEESRDRYLDLYEFAPVGYLTLTPTGLVTNANLSGAALLGVERLKLLQHRFAPYVTPLDRDRWHTLLLSVATHHNRQHADMNIQRPDGSVIHASLDCLCLTNGDQAPTVRVAITDITERKEAEQAIRASQEQLRLFIEQAPLSIAMLNPDMNYLATSRRWIDEFGRGQTDLVGRNYYDVHPDLSAEWQQIHRRALAGEACNNDEDKWVRADGSEHWLRWAVHPWTTATGKVGGIVISAEDITERKRSELALRDTARRKDEFLAMLAHELRNPLAPIRNAAHIIGRLGLDEPKIKWAQEVIETQVSHLAHMVDDLLDISRIVCGKIALKREAVELGPLIDQVIASARLLAEDKELRLTARLPNQAVWLEGAPVRLAQVLLNLLDNAVKYTPPGGQIDFDAHLAGEEIEIVIHDNGSGIHPALLPHVFDLFQQDERSPDRSQGGLGIGLTLVQRLVEMHGGRVAAHSPGQDQGATFTVWLPLGVATPEPVEHPGQSSNEAPPGIRVLVVDDDHAVADSTAVLLDMEGYRAHIAHSGEEALKLVNEFHPQVILLDIGLKGMDGFEAAQRLRELPEGKHLRLIAVTGYGDAETKERALECGCDRFLVKPMVWSALEALLREAV
ncbi:MAG: PAS domain S-box protein [Sulfuricella sp.]|nr:PAS domain S-box protein [Sulfuricella sp.]